MIKNYQSYKPSVIARFLTTELFAIEIDKLAGLQLRDDYEHIPDILRGEIVSDLSKKESVMTTIYGLVKLYENGNTIRVRNSDDIVNIYSLIYTHFRNIDNLTSGSIHPIKVDTEGLRILAMLAEEVYENNKASLTKHQVDALEEKMKIISPLSMTDMSSVLREFNYLPVSTSTRMGQNQISQNDVVLRAAQKDILY